LMYLIKTLLARAYKLGGPVDGCGMIG